MINIAKLLKDAPKGTKLYSPLFGEVKFLAIDSADSTIIVETERETHEWFSACGKYKVAKSHLLYSDSDCTLFPSKDYRTWQGWTPCVAPKFKVGDWVVCWNRTYQIIDNKSTYIVREINSLETRYEHSTVDENGHLWAIADAKDGDVLATDNGWTCIFKAFDGWVFSSYCFMDSQKWFCEVGAEGHTPDSKINGNIHPATKEQRDLFFKRMREAGYQWDIDKKELRKIQPHYDITNFHAGMPVLVRDYNNSQWSYVQFSHLIAERNVGEGGFKFNACGIPYIQCIPFEGNEHLLGTTDMCDEMYINW